MAAEEKRKRCPRGMCLAARLERSSDRSGGPEACWPWLLGRTGDGHGTMRWRGRTRYAHALAWEAANGPVPPGLVVMHACDRPGCVNPAHLRLGTHADNRADCVAKGRQAKGSGNGRAKLDEAKAREIRRRLEAGERKAALAREYGVDAAVVRRIGNGTLWRAALAEGGAA